MSDKYWEYLRCQECCYTCEFNLNAYKKGSKCDCKYNCSEPKFGQDVWCSNYEMKEN